MNKATKIVLAVPSLSTGGMERVTSTLLQEFAKCDHLELHLLLYGRKRDIFFVLPDKVKVHRPNFEFDRYPRFMATLKTVHFIRSTLTKLQPDSILNFGERWNNLVLASCVGTGLKILVSDRCQPEKSLGPIHDLLRTILYPRANGVIAQTQHAKAVFSQKIANSKLSVIPNPITIPAQADHPTREPLILSVGRLIPTKHHARLIRIFHARRNRDWKLAILGDDPYDGRLRKTLQELIIEIGEQDHISLPGTIADVSHWYSKASIFAFTSSSEGFPNALAEAMAHGLPAIAYDGPAGIRDLISSEDLGFLVPMFDDKKFLETMDLLTDDRSLREKVGGSAKIAARNLSSEKIAALYLEKILEGTR